jgi:hypothetical protein
MGDPLYVRIRHLRQRTMARDDGRIDLDQGTSYATDIAVSDRTCKCRAHSSIPWRVAVDFSLSTLRHWLFLGSNAYVEYTFVPWLNRSVYRRTVPYSAICIQ